MARAASRNNEDPTEQVELDESDVNKRRDILAKRIGERDKVKAQKAAYVKKTNETLRLLDEQVTTLGTEIRERRAWVPATVLPGMESARTAPREDDIENDDPPESDAGDDEIVDPVDHPPERTGQNRRVRGGGKKKRASKKTRA